jgi:hypothetical protein
MGSSAVHWFRQQFPKHPEPPPFPKGNPIRETGEDPAIRLLEGMRRAHESLIYRRQETIRQESLILITTAAAVCSLHLIRMIAGRKGTG